MGAGVANIPITPHMNGGNIVGMAVHVHLGNANFDADLNEAGSQTAILDVLGYSAAPGHTSRANAGDFDTKMHDIYGSQYDNLDGAYKDAIFLNFRSMTLLIKGC